MNAGAEASPMAPTVEAIRHVHFEDLGTLAPALAERGAAIRYREAGLDDLTAVDPLAADLLVVLGGPISAGDDALYSFLADELRILESRLAAGRPTLGVCLGAQLMARAIGARVYPAAAKEIGWAPIRLTEAGRASPLATLGEDGGTVLHWHGDTFDLPAGTTLLASTDACPHQAFSYGRSALALQFHVEASVTAMERWLIGHACEIAATPGVDVTGLRADTTRHSASLARRARAFLDAWLGESGLTAARP